MASHTTKYQLLDSETVSIYCSLFICKTLSCPLSVQSSWC